MIKAAAAGGGVVDTRKSERASVSCSPTGEPSRQQIIRKEAKRIPPPPQDGFGKLPLASVSPRRDESLRWSCQSRKGSAPSRSKQTH